MSLKSNFKQIVESEWEKGDFRPIAEVHKSTDELFNGWEINFSEYFEECLGCKYKVAFFQTASNRRFFVTEYFNVPSPLTNIFVLYDKEMAMSDLNEIKSLLNLRDADLMVYDF